MVLPPPEINRPFGPRLDPAALRKARPCLDAEGAGAQPSGSDGPLLVARKSFWECEAEYNPLGQFGAPFSRRL
jgi:hypothetical protein